MTISCIIKPQKGEIDFEGNLLNVILPHKLVSLGISHVPEGRRIFPRLTVRENLELGAYALGVADQVQLEKILRLFPILRERGEQMGGTLSGGEQQMLAIGRALMSKPRLLLLDEPSLGLSDSGYVLENGKVSMHGAGCELINSEQVKKAYFGE